MKSPANYPADPPAHANTHDTMQMNNLPQEEENGEPKSVVYMLFDKRMTLHKTVKRPNNSKKSEVQMLHMNSPSKNNKSDETEEGGCKYENSERITCIYDRMIQLEERLTGVPAQVTAAAQNAIIAEGIEKEEKNGIPHQQHSTEMTTADNSSSASPASNDLHLISPSSVNEEKKEDESSSTATVTNDQRQISPRPTANTSQQKRQPYRFHQLTCKPASKHTIELAHASRHYEKLHQTTTLTDKQLQNLQYLHDREDDLFFCKDTFLAATLSCGGVVTCVNAVTNKEGYGENGGDGAGRSNRAIAIVRPPGHHACLDKAMGFCFFNNVAVAAKHAIHTGRANRVCIIDWDIHHGNGTQDLTFDDPNIFYVSLHRLGANPSTSFYPGTGQPEEVGFRASSGANLNIGWTQSAMGDAEYAAALSELVLPLLCAYKPDLILISCGFDAVDGDHIGDCKLSPGMYYTMTKSIMKTVGVNVPLVVALEGGYNLNIIPTCMEAVALALLDEPLNLGGKAKTWKRESVDGSPRRLNRLGAAAAGKANPTDKNSTNRRKSNRSGRKKETRMSLQNRLEEGRKELLQLWNHHATNEKQRGLAKSSAVRSINRSMRAIRNTAMWKDSTAVNLVDVPEQLETEFSIKTRSQRTEVPFSTKTRSRRAQDPLFDANQTNKRSKLVAVK